VDEKYLPDFLQRHPSLQQGMFAAKRASLANVTPLSKTSPAVIAQMLGRRGESSMPQQRPSTFSTPSQPYDGAGQGVSARAAYVGIRADQSRKIYERGVGMLDPTDGDGRLALKAKARAITPPEVLAPIAKWRPGLGPAAGSGGRANVSNASVNQVARYLGRLGKGPGIVGTLVALDDILTSAHHLRALSANVGAGLGGFVGGVTGAAAGAATGPAAPVLAPAGRLAGSLAGGRLGYKAGEDAYDFLAKW
jgi:hypothetical protein